MTRLAERFSGVKRLTERALTCYQSVDGRESDQPRAAKRFCPQAIANSNLKHNPLIPGPSPPSGRRETKRRGFAKPQEIA